MCGELHPDKQAIPACAVVSDDSEIRVKALKIAAMEAAGVSRDEIAVALKISRETISGYLYKAGKNGWLVFDDPKNTLEYQILHKAVRNLDELLDTTNEEIKTEVTLKTLDGMVWRKDAQQAQQGQQTIVGVRVEVVQGAPTQVREGTVMGNSQYVDATVVKPEE